MSINDKQEAFCQEYCINGFIAKAAYKKAYPQSSDKACESSSSDLLRNPKIKERIAQIKAELETKNKDNKAIRQDFWRREMQNAANKLTDRLRASELWGKSEADFTENINNTTNEQEIELTKEDMEVLKELSVKLRQEQLKLKRA